MCRVKTASQILVDVENPMPEMLNINDIAYGLAGEHRFGNQAYPRYTVAQHSVIVSQYVQPCNALAGLLHDASEAYIHDMPREVKHHPKLEGYRQLEDNLMLAIAKKFGFQWPLPEDVHVIDKRLCYDEVKYFMNSSRGMNAMSNLEPLGLPYICVWSGEEAEARFLCRFWELTR